MQKPEIEQSLISMLAGYAKDGFDIDSEADLVADLGLESVRVLEFIVDVEDEFDVIIDIESLSNVHTVGQLAGVVERALRA